MNKIQILSEQTANFIAAGEVVERPASVLKELLENALDAGARRIEVELQQAGSKLIRVVDDGCGMTPEDAVISFSRHATSKIREAKDLEKIRTFGFRGEALPSIAAVSRIEMVTRPAEAMAGYRVRIQGGKLMEREETGCAPGTSIWVKDLFFNTPARRKFLKSPATEQGHLVEALEFCALANLQTSFQLISDGRDVLHCPAASSLENRILSIYGKSLHADFVPIEQEHGAVRLFGLAALPASSRPNRQGMKFFINQRPVDHRGLAHAVLQAYRPLIPEGRFPICFLFLTIPAENVDVNVHPAKREVRLRDEHANHEMVRLAVRQALESQSAVLPAATSPVALYKAAEHAPAMVSEPQPLPMGWSRERVQNSMAAFEAASHRHQEIQGNLENPSDIAYAAGENLINIFGQIGGLYLIGQDENGLFIIDQHAANERFLYDQLKQVFQTPVPGKPLLLPIQFEVRPGLAELLSEMLGAFRGLGIDISPLGDNIFIVQTSPEAYEKGDLIQSIKDILDNISESGGRVDSGIFLDSACRSLACHAAVKAGDRLQPEIIEYLVHETLKGKHVLVCPHGRPYLFRLGWKDLDKIFKRA